MKTNSKTGEITYQHQMLDAVIVHPDIRKVIPLAPEPIIKQDGESKMKLSSIILSDGRGE
jgi:hypothetical protein